MQTDSIAAPGRPRTFNPQEALEKATVLFWQKGYDSTSMTELLQEMGIGKGSFYLIYPGGKKELFEKVLHEQGVRLIDSLRLELKTNPEPLEGIKNFFRNIASADSESWYNGCFISNTLIEQTNRAPSLRGQAMYWLEKLEKELTTALKKARKNGTFKARQKPKIVAKYLVSAWNGLHISRRMVLEKKDLKKIIDLQLSILE